jgi:hypothetical protein
MQNVNPTLSNEDKKRIALEAIDDALLHQAEFPGEPIKGDWDAEAFSEVKATNRDLAWDWYYAVLHSAVDAIVGNHLDRSDAETLCDVLRKSYIRQLPTNTRNE